MTGCGDDGPKCGDGRIDLSEGERCDDGNTNDGDGCSATCTIETPAPSTPICGDGKKEGSEQCDDGNKANGDGCSATCQTETPTSSCPAVGSSCSVENEMKCCNDNVFYCNPNESKKLVWNVWNCQEYSEELGFETHCHSVTSGKDVWAECTNECAAENLGIIMDNTSDCYEGNFEIWVCEKTDQNKYALMGGYYLNSLCWIDSTKLVCNADELVETVDCANCEDTDTGAVCH
jgi:cysteine-rich repeat protein